MRKLIYIYLVIISFLTISSLECIPFCFVPVKTVCMGLTVENKTNEPIEVYVDRNKLGDVAGNDSTKFSCVFSEIGGGLTVRRYEIRILKNKDVVASEEYLPDDLFNRKWKLTFTENGLK